MKKLKNINFKALFIDHAEKFGLGLIVMFVLLALSSTSWSRYAGTPGDLEKKAKDKRTHINSPDANPWPKEKQEGFKVVDFNDRATQLFSRIDQTKYEFATPIWHPLYRKRELAREPEFLPVEFLISSPGRAILGVKAILGLIPTPSVSLPICLLSSCTIMGPVPCRPPPTNL